MNLKTPRENPYDPLNKTLEKVSEQGFRQEWSILDEKTCQVPGTDKKFRADELTIQDVERITPIPKGGERPFLDDKELVVLIEASSGERGYILDMSGKKGDPVVYQFLQNVDRFDQLSEYYSA